MHPSSIPRRRPAATAGLQPETSAAHASASYRCYLPVLTGFGSLALRGIRLSTPSGYRPERRLVDLGRGFDPARADCGCRAPLTPHLARPAQEREPRLCGRAPQVKWWSRWESNPRPLECDSSALPTELLPHRIRKTGGERGIRTLGDATNATHDFQSCTFDHSVISPDGGEGGIRTHGDREGHNGFRDRPLRPLGHLSARLIVPTSGRRKTHATDRRIHSREHRRRPRTCGSAAGPGPRPATFRRRRPWDRRRRRRAGGSVPGRSLLRTWRTARGLRRASYPEVDGTRSPRPPGEWRSSPRAPSDPDPPRCRCNRRPEPRRRARQGLRRAPRRIGRPAAPSQGLETSRKPPPAPNSQYNQGSSHDQRRNGARAP